ncbi:MAG: hypothetical protein PHC45_08250, partial [Clostridiaceae bacterium]|nr:hypothetical protein [Clostridiaceae bacterium]
KLLRYVHQNPVRAGICKTVEDYKWSSDIYYRKNIRGVVNTKVIYEMLDINIVDAIKKYKEFMDEPEEENYSRMDAIGDEAYQIMCLSRKEEKQRKRLDEILFETGVTLREYEQIKGGSRNRELTEYKLKYAIAAKEQHYTLKEIGENIGMKAVSVKNMLDRYCGRIT